MRTFPLPQSHDPLRAPAQQNLHFSSGHADAIPDTTGRRYWPVSTSQAELLDARHLKASDRRFTGEPITAFGALA